MPPNSTKYDLITFGITLNFIDIFLKPFITSYLHQTKMYCKEMHEMFKKTPVTLLEPDGYKNKRQLLLTGIGGEWYTNKLR